MPLKRRSWWSAIILFSLIIGNMTYVKGSEPPSSLHVSIPDYEVTTEEGYDYVEIPGGEILFEANKPMVPYYMTSMNYPKGYVVQGVVLESRAGLQTSTGLKIPSCITVIVGTKASSSSEETSPWFPEADFTWEVYSHSNRSTTLNLIIYPFYYNAETTDVKFYKEYDFRINYILSTVEITRLSLDKEAYDSGETATITLELVNTGEAKDVLVSAVINEEGDNQIIDGLQLRRLKALQGYASFSTLWNITSFASGIYQISIELKDDSGNILDRGLRYFTLGACLCKITKFEVKPQNFTVGEEIKMTLGIKNVGSKVVSGRCVFKVQETEGIIQEFTHNFSVLAPDKSLTFTSAWNTSTAKTNSTYHIHGYVTYEGQTTPPMITRLYSAAPSEEGQTPIPLWVIAVATAAILIAGISVSALYVTRRRGFRPKSQQKNRRRIIVLLVLPLNFPSDTKEESS